MWSNVRGARRRALRRTGWTAAALVAVSLLAACASLGRAIFKEPVVHFRELRLNGLGMTGGSLDLVLSVYNPNDFQLEATRFTYNLVMDSVPVANGVLDETFMVQRGDSSLVRIPISFTYAGLGQAGRQLMQSGTINYRVVGDVTVGTPLGNFTRPYDQAGRYTPLRGAQSGRARPAR